MHCAFTGRFLTSEIACCKYQQQAWVMRWHCFKPRKLFSSSSELQAQLTMQHDRPSECRSRISSRSKRFGMSWLAIVPVFSDSQATRLFIKVYYLLTTRPNSVKFRQLVCECTGINQHTTGYGLKLGVMTSLSLFWRKSSVDFGVSIVVSEK